MKHIKFVAFVVIISIIGYACKKAPVDNKVFVQNALIGKWPIKYQISSVVKNGTDTVSFPDTTKFSSPDTVEFTKDLKFIKRKDTIRFAADDLGEHVTFTTTPDSTWTIAYLRRTSFKLVYVRKESVGADIFSYITERDFVK